MIDDLGDVLAEVASGAVELAGEVLSGAVGSVLEVAGEIFEASGDASTAGDEEARKKATRVEPA